MNEFVMFIILNAIQSYNERTTLHFIKVLFILFIIVKYDKFRRSETRKKIMCNN